MPILLDSITILLYNLHIVLDLVRIGSVLWFASSDSVRLGSSRVVDSGGSNFAQFGSCDSVRIAGACTMCCPLHCIVLRCSAPWERCGTFALLAVAFCYTLFGTSHESACSYS